jgi:purine-binding chemotaxis protein CheW
MDEIKEFQSGPRTQQKRFLTFRLEQQVYALPAENVSEVIEVPPVARVPQAPPGLLGIANLRGAILPLVSLRGLLGVVDAVSYSSSRAIVLAGNPPAAVAVDAVHALVSIEVDRIEAQPIKLGAGAHERLTGAFQSNNGTVKVLDIQVMLDTAFAARALPVRPQARAREIMVRNTTTATDLDAEVLITFDVAGGEYALPLNAVEEILPAPEALTAMPDMDTSVRGMMAFRGQLLPLLSLRSLLGASAFEEETGLKKIIVTTVRGALVGLVADRTRAIVTAERALIEPMPTVLAARIGGETKISAIYRGENGRRLISIISPEQLFREDVMRRLDAERGATSAKDATIEGTVSDERKFLVFRLGDDEFGLPIDAVDEVARVPEAITRVPKTPKFLEGIVNLRGDVLPVVDQRRRFDMPKLEHGETRRLIVVRTARHRAGLIVDSVSEVLRCPADAIEATPELTEDTTRLVSGVVNLKSAGRIVLLLEPAELLTRAEHSLLDSFKPSLG